MKFLKEDGANLRAAKSLTKIIAVVVILAVAAFGDVMYIQAMSSKFPQGPLLIMCYIGAFTSFLAVMYLLLGKSIAFRPGGQMIGAWVVFVAELLIIGLNILLVFSPHGGGFMDAWATISPASPVLHMLGVALLFFLDPDLMLKHHEMEMAERMQKSEREVEELTHKAKIELRKKQVTHVSKSLEEAVNSPESLAYIQQFGYKINLELLRELTGMNSIGGSQVPALPAPRGASPLSLPGSADVEEWQANEEYLNQVNDRIASERQRRLEQEAQARADLGGSPKDALPDESVSENTVDRGREAARQELTQQVMRMAVEAEHQGKSLNQIEQWLGLESSLSGAGDRGFLRHYSLKERVDHIVSAGLYAGYNAQGLLDLLERSWQGGDDAKKK